MLTPEQIQDVANIRELHGRLVLLYDKSDAERKLLLALHKTLGIIDTQVLAGDEDYKRGYAAGYAAKRKPADKPEPAPESAEVKSDVL